LRVCAQIGNLQAVAQFLCNASKSLSGTLADVLSPARMIIFGTVLTTLNKPMFAGSGAVYAAFGTVATLYWVTAGERACPCRLARQSGCCRAPAGMASAGSTPLQDEPSISILCLCTQPCFQTARREAAASGSHRQHRYSFTHLRARRVLQRSGAVVTRRPGRTRRARKPAPRAQARSLTA
jgi:drug/metabolite transporter superfamily protein YnfA